MAARAVFYQECPVCGRSLRIAVQLFGRKVECVHCGGEFVAIESAGNQRESAAPASLLREPMVRLPLHLDSLSIGES
jgi:hypothetical protein